MTVEAATYIHELNASLPDGSDPLSEGDNHDRLIKSTLKSTFPNFAGVVNASNTELNLLAGKTLTSNGAKLDNLPAGTTIPFFQAAAPSGWTQVTSHNDKALRVVNGAGGGSAGTHGLSSPPSTTHTHTGPSHTHTVDAHVHVGGAHSHGYTTDTDSVTLKITDWSSPSAGDIRPTLSGGVNDQAATTEEHSHSHTGSTASGGTVNTSSSGGGNTGASGTGNTGSSGPTAFAPLYIDVILCSKDA